MNTRSALAACLFSMLLFGEARSQGAYLDEGESGYGIGTWYATSDRVSGVGAEIGFCSIGKVDLTYSYLKITSDGNLGYATSSSLTFYPAKQNSTDVEGTLGLSVSYVVARGRGSGLSAGAMLLKRFAITESYALQPAIGLAWMPSVREGYRIQSVASFGLSLYTRRKGKLNSFVTTSLANGNGPDTYSIGIGLIISRPENPAARSRK